MNSEERAQNLCALLGMALGASSGAMILKPRSQSQQSQLPSTAYVCRKLSTTVPQKYFMLKNG